MVYRVTWRRRGSVVYFDKRDTKGAQNVDTETMMGIAE